MHLKTCIGNVKILFKYDLACFPRKRLNTGNTEAQLAAKSETIEKEVIRVHRGASPDECIHELLTVNSPHADDCPHLPISPPGPSHPYTLKYVMSDAFGRPNNGVAYTICFWSSIDQRFLGLIQYSPLVLISKIAVALFSCACCIIVSFAPSQWYDVIPSNRNNVDKGIGKGRS